MNSDTVEPDTGCLGQTSRAEERSRHFREVLISDTFNSLALQSTLKKNKKVIRFIITSLKRRHFRSAAVFGKITVLVKKTTRGNSAVGGETL